MLIVIDGLDHYNSTTDMLYRTGNLTYNSVAGNVGLYYPGRNGLGGCVQCGLGAYQSQGTAFNDQVNGAFPTNYSTFYIGLALQLIEQSSTAGNQLPQSMSFSVIDWSTGGNGSTQFKVQLSQIGSLIQVYNSAGTIIGTAVAAFPVGTWFFLEIGGTINTTTGSVTVRINGDPKISLTGVNTQLSTNAYMNGFRLQTELNGGGGSKSNPYGFRWDDFYLCDNTAGPGVYPTNTFLGDVRVGTLFAEGDGATIQWTPSNPALLNWQEISETQLDGDASYNSTSTVNNEDLFNFQPLRTTVTNVIAVQITGAYRKDDAGTHTIQHRIKNGASETGGSNLTVSSGWAYVSDMYILNPNSGVNWTLNDVNTGQFGYKLIS